MLREPANLSDSIPRCTRRTSKPFPAPIRGQAIVPLAAMHHLKHVDSAECHDAFMFLPHKKPKNGRGGHGDRADRQLLALRIGVHRMQ